MSLRLPLALLAGAVLSLSACTDAAAPFVTPSVTVLRAARTLQEQLPGAAVEFSQHTGAIVRVDAPGLTGLGEPTAGPGVPLVESRGADEAGELASLREYFDRFGALHGLADGGAELWVPRDQVNDALLLPQERFANGDLVHLADLRLHRLVQTIQGVPVPGRDVIGFFDAQGGLQSVTTRLLPVDAAFPVTPAFDAAGLWQRFPTSLRDAAAQRKPALAWLSATTALEHAGELTVELVAPGGALDSAHPAAKPRLAYRLAVRQPGQQALLVVDALTGALLDAWDTMPSDWASEGTAEVSGSLDETGNRSVLFLDTVFNGTRTMGIIKSNGSPDWIDPGNYVAVSDTSGRGDLTMTYYSPMTIPTTVGGAENRWNNDASYVGGKRQAGALVAAITTTFDYWNDRRSWRGWDGQGSNFWASIYNHKNGSKPELNAWGGNGIIQVGDGTTSTGQFLGSSREVMGHELTHNVITATTQLQYLNESGAVNEALADLFGVAMTADRAADDYATDVIGDDVGWNLRNMKDPTLTGQPAEYKDYKTLADDSGGVHTNSGILNKAHTLLVKGGTFKGVTVPRVGLARVEQILWASMRFKAYGQTATMEEFAQGVLSICKVTDGLNRVFGDTSYAATCSAFRKAYVAVGVLPSFAHLEVAAAQGHAGVLAALASNGSGRDVTGVLSRASFLVTDTATGARFTLPGRAARTDADGGTAADFLAGDRLVLTADLPAELKGPGNRRRVLDVALQVEGLTEDRADLEPLHHAGLVLGSNLMAGAFTLTPSGRVFQVQVALENPEGSGLPAGVKGMLLARFGAHAPFDLFDGLTGQQALPADMAGAGPAPWLDLLGGAGQYNFFNGLPLFEVPTATPVPGKPGKYQVWFDAQGGLDVLDQHLQVYVLVDSGDQVDELDETDNLLCVSCVAPGQARGTSGVIVRLPKGTPVATLFPASVQAAAARLPAAHARALPVSALQSVRLPFRLPLGP